MKARNMLITFFTVLLCCYGNMAFSDDTPEGSAKAAVSGTTVNINEADAETLASVLDGIGLRRANDIVAYREAHGLFYSAEELSAVRGIGRATVEKNTGKITVK